MNEKRISYALRTADGRLGCTLRTDRTFRFSDLASVGCGSDTAAYAVCRYIRHCPELRDLLVREAVRLGLSSRGGKNKRRTVLTRAAALSLPGGGAEIRLCVRQGEIVVRSLTVFRF